MKPGWRWMGVGAAILVATLVVSAWIKQRAAHQPDITQSAPGVSPSPASKPVPAAAEPKQGPAPARPPRDRPERDRADRP